MGISGIGNLNCKWFQKSANFEFDIKSEETESDAISIQEFDNLIPQKIFKKMTNANIKSNKNNVKFKTIKIDNNQLENEENKREIYYHGEFNKEGQKDGKGKMIIINQNKEKIFYYGLWENDILNSGKIYYINDEEYEGEIKNYLRDGKGKFISQNETYEGNWREDKKDGKGKLKYKDGTLYEGDFKNNQFNGKGKINFPNGIKYNGEFVNNLFHGQGCLEGNNCHIYNGNFKNGQFNGYGEFKWIDENGHMDVYKGNYTNGKKDGKGELYFKNGDIFDGNWESGNPHGEGNYETKNRKYFGNWRSGIFTQLIDVETKVGGEEEKLNLNFITPIEDIYNAEELFSSLNSNSSSIRQQSFNASVEII